MPLEESRGQPLLTTSSWRPTGKFEGLHACSDPQDSPKSACKLPPRPASLSISECLQLAGLDFLHLLRCLSCAPCRAVGRDVEGGQGLCVLLPV